MAKKNKPTPPKDKAFNSNPFSTLKGFAVSGGRQEENTEPKEMVKVDDGAPISFAEEMALLGVEPLSAGGEEGLNVPEPSQCVAETTRKVQLSEDEQFLQAMGDLQVKFKDSFPEEELPPVATPKRMKQLRQGKLVPEATLDLHGLKRIDVVPKLQYFLQNARHQGWRTLLVITGRGLHSFDGEPVLRTEAEYFLQGEGRSSVAEWARAPKQYGGDGALVLFLREAQP